MNNRIIKVLTTLCAVVIVLDQLLMAQSIVVGPNGRQWPPISLAHTEEGGCWYYSQENEEDASGETGLGLTVSPTSSGGVQLLTTPVAKAIPLGGVAGWGTAMQRAVNQLRCVFRVEHSGEYLFTGSLTINQVLDSWGFSVLGDNRGAYDITHKVGIYKDEDVFIAGPGGTPIIWTKDDADSAVVAFIETVALESYSKLIEEAAKKAGASSFPFWVGPASSFAAALIEASEDGRIEEACLYNEDFSFEFSVPLDPGIDYEWRIGSDVMVFAQVFGVGVWHQTALTTRVQLYDLSISMIRPKIIVKDPISDEYVNSVDFVSLPIGNMMAKTLKVLNEGERPLQITRWASSNSAFSLSPLNPSGDVGDITLNPGESFDLKITFSPYAETEYLGQVEIQSNDPEKPSYLLALSGMGLENQSGIHFHDIPSFVQSGSSIPVIVTVLDEYGASVGSGHEVMFKCSSGEWSDYHHVGGNEREVYAYTDSDGEAWVTWHARETDAVLLEVFSEPDHSASAYLTVESGPLDFEFAVAKFGGDGATWAEYKVNVTISDSVTGIGLNSYPIEWQTSKGTVASRDPQTNGAGEASGFIRTTEPGSATITVTVPAKNQSGSVSTFFQIVPGMSHPAGRQVAVASPGGSHTMDINTAGTTIAVASGSALTLIDSSTWQRQVHTLIFFESTDIVDIAFRDNSSHLGMTSNNSRKNAIYTIAGLSASPKCTWESTSDLAVGLSCDWVGSQFVIGHAAGVDPYEFSSYNSSCGLIDKVNKVTSHGCKIITLVARPQPSSDFAAVCNHNPYHIFYMWADGSSIGQHITPFAAPNRIYRGGLAWHPGGNLLVVGSPSFEHQMTIFAVPGFSQLHTISTNWAKEWMAFSGDGNYLAVAGDGKSKIEVFDTSSGTVSHWNQKYIVHVDGGVRALSWLPNSHTLVACCGNMVQLSYIDDRTPPSVVINAPDNGHSTSAEEIAIKGNATDNNGLLSGRIQINEGTPQDLELDGSGSFSTMVPLEIGDNNIMVEVKDITGWIASDSITVVRETDNCPPLIENATVDPTAGRPGDQFTISASITDSHSGVKEDTTIARMKMLDGSVAGTLSLIHVSDDIYSGTWDSSGVPSGDYQVSIAACDNAEPCNCIDSQNMEHFTINEAPTVALDDFADITLYPGNDTTISWNTIDSDSECLTSLYLKDAIDSEADIIPIPGGIGLAEDVSSMELNADDFNNGVYYVLGQASDEYGTVSDTSTGLIIILLHDESSNPAYVEESVTYAASTIGATGTDITSCGTADANDVWHFFTPSQTGNYLVSLCGTEFDATIAVFDSASVRELACYDAFPSCESGSGLTIGLTEQVSYLIRVAGENGENGNYSLAVSLIEATPGDFNFDENVNSEDMVILALHWLSNCDYPDWCQGADIDHSSVVDFADYGVVAEHWLPTTVLTIPSDGAPVPSSSLISGQWYEIRANGTYQGGSDSSSICDAEWYYWTGDGQWHEESMWSPPERNDLLINGVPVDWEGTTNGVDFAPHVFSPNHIYRIRWEGQGEPITLKVSDTNYGDNIGSLTVTITSIDL